MKSQVPIAIGGKPIKTNDAGLVSLTDGHVYVIEVAKDVCKVGASNNPKQRVKTHASALPDDFSNVYVSPRVRGYMRMEKEVHAALKKHLVRNEVFSVTFPDAVASVTEILASFDPTPPDVVRATKKTDGEALQLLDFATQLERVGLSEIALRHYFSSEVAAKVLNIHPESAAVALAAFLCGEAPSVEIAYAAIVLEEVEFCNQSCTDHCDLASHRVMRLLNGSAA